MPSTKPVAKKTTSAGRRAHHQDVASLSPAVDVAPRTPAWNAASGRQPSATGTATTTEHAPTA